jgi:hypothetical protein
VRAQGTPVTLLRDVPFSFIFFPSYANLKALFSDADVRAHDAVYHPQCQTMRD